MQDIRSLYAIAKYIRKNSIDVVVGHTPKGALLAMMAAFLLRVKKRIYFRHGLVYETSVGFKRFLLMWIDRIASFCATEVVCVSNSVLKQSEEDRLSPFTKQCILGDGTCSGIDTQGKFNPDLLIEKKRQEMLQTVGISPNDFVVGYCGRLVRDKGIIELVEAFDLFRQKLPNAKLLLVGMFEERDALPEEMKQKILNDSNIIYTGFVNTDQEYYYSMMSVYVLPSYREGFPTGVLEASSMGCPVITTRVTGCIDSIIDGQTGYFTDRTPADIVQKLHQVANARDVLSQSARTFVVEKFDNQIVWKEIEKLYQ